MPGRVIGRTKSLGGQLDVPGPVPLQHQAAGHPVAWPALGLHPVPGRTQFGREPPPAQSRMGGNQLPDKLDFGGADLAAPISKLARHGRQLRESGNAPPDPRWPARRGWATRQIAPGKAASDTTKIAVSPEPLGPSQGFGTAARSQAQRQLRSDLILQLDDPLGAPSPGSHGHFDKPRSSYLRWSGWAGAGQHVALERGVIQWQGLRYGTQPMRSRQRHNFAPPSFRDRFPMFALLAPAGQGGLHARNGCRKRGIGFRCCLRRPNVTPRLPAGVKPVTHVCRSNTM